MIFADASAIDAPEIASLVNQAYRATGGKMGWTNEHTMIEGPRTSELSVRSLLACGRIVVVRDVLEGSIVGCIHVANDDDGAWHTSMLAVDPNTQTAGVGKAIKEELARQARMTGASRMRMEVIRQRGALIARHRRRGYEPTGEVLRFPYDDPSVGRPRLANLELVVMEKVL